MSLFIFQKFINGDIFETIFEYFSNCNLFLFLVLMSTIEENVSSHKYEVATGTNNLRPSFPALDIVKTTFLLYCFLRYKMVARIFGFSICKWVAKSKRLKDTVLFNK